MLNLRRQTHYPTEAGENRHLALGARCLLVLCLLLATFPLGQTALPSQLDLAPTAISASVGAQQSWQLGVAVHPEGSHGTARTAPSTLHLQLHDAVAFIAPAALWSALTAALLYLARSAYLIYVVLHERFFTPPRAPTA